MSSYDEVADKIGEDQWKEWKRQVFDYDAQLEIGMFVASRRAGGKAVGIVNCFAGSFNLCLQVRFDDGGSDAIIRFPGPGHTTFRDEKVANEVQVIRFLHANTNIPVPRLISWGLTKDCPRHLGPFIISEFAGGVTLSDILKDPSDKARLYLDPNIDGRVFNTIFEQIADFLLQLSQFEFPRIGALSEDWAVTRRPLTYIMNELATTAFYPVDQLSTTTFESASDYFKHISSQHLTHLWTQRNLCTSPYNAQERFIARHLFARLVDKYCIDTYGPFKLFCDDLRPQNMLVDPDSLLITAVLDLEFTNVMPGQFASEPPWFLLLAGPDNYITRGHTLQEWKEAYEPRLEQFLQAMERVEKARGMQPDQDTTLSSRMRESWASKRFWFNYAARKPFDVDDLFYKFLCEGAADIDCLDQEARQELDRFVETKMEQLKEHDLDCKNRGL